MTEEKEYLTHAEVAKLLGISRASVYNYTQDLGIKTYRFKRSKYAYIARADYARLQEAVKKPWLMGEKKEEDRAIA